MEFNVSKCKVMHYGRSNIRVGYSYSMDSQAVAVVDCEKDLGVVFSQDMKAAVIISKHTLKPTVC